MKEKVINWIKAHKSFIVILTTLIVSVGLIHYFGWWEALGILFIKFGLGIKVSGAKTFARAVAKAGGKKVLATATAGMLLKRHLIDVVSKFFAEHSISRIKDSAKMVLKLKLKEFKETSFMKKLQAFGAFLLSIPGVYFFWTKVLSVAIQKLVYGFMFTLLTFIWNFISGMFNVLGFILEVLALNVLLDAISSYKWGQVIIKGIDSIIYFIGDIFLYINRFIKWFFSLFGITFDIKGFVISKSIQFNEYLVSILEKGLTKITKIQNKRDRYVNAVEKISEKRFIYYQERRDKKVSFMKSVKESFRKRISKKKTWREKREEKLEKQKEKRLRTIAERRKKAILENKKRKQRNKGSALVLPYQELAFREK
jgi:hypothetical protein